MSLRLAVHWTITTLTAAAVSIAAPLPFTGHAAGLAGAIATAGVCCIGYATAPNPTRKDHR